MPWPEAGLALVSELRAHPGRLALAPVGPGLDDGLDAIATLLDTTVFRVGVAVTNIEQPPDADDVRSLLEGASVLTDLDVLFWINIDVLRLLSELARHRPIVAAWPGQIEQSRATYSLPGRRDFYEARLADVVVLRTRTRRFPDQTPFDVEHIPRFTRAHMPASARVARDRKVADPRPAAASRLADDRNPADGATPVDPATAARAALRAPASGTAVVPARVSAMAAQPHPAPRPGTGPRLRADLATTSVTGGTGPSTRCPASAWRAENALPVAADN